MTPRDRRIEITRMQAADLDAVLEVERHAFRSPWSRQILAGELERDFAHLDVARVDGSDRAVDGYVNFWHVHDEVHLLNIAVHPDARRRGLGRALMEHLVGFARAHACRYVTLEVRRSNRPAIELYRASGFRSVGVRPRYYADDDEDAVVMLLELPPAGG